MPRKTDPTPPTGPGTFDPMVATYAASILDHTSRLVRLAFAQGVFGLHGTKTLIVIAQQVQATAHGLSRHLQGMDK